MKKFILSALLPFVYFLCTLLPFFSLPARAAQASAPAVGSYACILESDAYFYASRDEQRGLFLLPKTYFVKVLEPADDFCRIEYLYDDAHVKRLVGYAKTEKLTFVDFIPERPYLYYLFEVSYSLEGGSSPTGGVLDTIKLTCAYYGDYAIGATTYCYVLRGEEFGYIPKPASLSYDENTEYADHVRAETPTAPPAEPTTESKNSSPAQIAILIALCLLVPVLAALILKPPRRPPYETDE